MSRPELERLRRAVSKGINYPSYDLVGDNPEEIHARANAIILMRYGKTPIAHEKMELVKTIITEQKEGVTDETEQNQLGV